MENFTSGYVTPVDKNGEPCDLDTSINDYQQREEIKNENGEVVGVAVSECGGEIDNNFTLTSEPLEELQKGELRDISIGYSKDSTAEQIEVLQESEDLKGQIDENAQTIADLEIEYRKRPPAKDADKINQAIRNFNNKKFEAPPLTDDFDKTEINHLYSVYEEGLSKFYPEETLNCTARIPIETVLRSSQVLVTACIDATLKKGTVNLKFKNIDAERKVLVESGIIRYICESTELMYKSILELAEHEGFATDNVFKVELYTTAYIRSLFNTLMLLENREFYTRTAGYKKIKDFINQLVDLVRAVRLRDTDVNEIMTFEKEAKDILKDNKSKFEKENNGRTPTEDEIVIFTKKARDDLLRKIRKPEEYLTCKGHFISILRNWESATLLNVTSRPAEEVLAEAKTFTFTELKD